MLLTDIKVDVGSPNLEAVGGPVAQRERSRGRGGRGGRGGAETHPDAEIEGGQRVRARGLWRGLHGQDLGQGNLLVVVGAGVALEGEQGSLDIRFFRVILNSSAKYQQVARMNFKKWIVELFENISTVLYCIRNFQVITNHCNQ